MQLLKLPHYGDRIERNRKSIDSQMEDPQLRQAAIDKTWPHGFVEWAWTRSRVCVNHASNSNARPLFRAPAPVR